MGRDVMTRVAERNPEAAQKAGRLNAVPDIGPELENMRGHLEGLLPPNSGGVNRFIQIALTAYQRTEGLDKVCTTATGRASFFGAVTTAAQLGLPVGGPTQQSWILPFSQSSDEGRIKVAQFILGAAGMATLFWRHPLAQYLQTEVVYENDEFDFELGVGGFLHHKPVRVDDLSNERGLRGNAIYWYAVAQLTSGAYTFKVL